MSPSTRVVRALLLEQNNEWTTRSPTHKPHPDSCGGEFDDGEIVRVVLFKAGCDSSEMLDFAEEPLDVVAVSIEERAECRDVDPVRHWLDIGPSALFLQALAQRIAVVSPVGKQDLSGTEIVEHVVGAAAVMRLALAQLERDRIAVAVDQRMDFGRQSAARTPHASGWSVVPFRGLRTPFLTLAAC